jgi:capsule polysaccharide modification protein KpsS
MVKNKNEKIFIIGAVHKIWAPITEELLNLDHEVSIAFWREERKKWGKINLQNRLTIEDLWKFKNLNSKDEVEQYTRPDKDFIQLFNMLDRQESNLRTIYPGERKDIINNELTYWHSFLSTQNISSIIMTNVPHRFWDYAIYIAAKELKIQVHIFALSQFGSNVFYYDDIESKAKTFNENYCLNKELIHSHLQKVRNLNEMAIPDYMLKQKRQNKGTVLYLLILKYFNKLLRFRLNDLYKFKHPNVYRKLSPELYSDPDWLRHFIDEVLKYFFLKNLKKSYEKIASKEFPKRKFYYFPLHYQPEETTLPSGLGYHNQIMVIKQLLEYLPSDTDLVIKEHQSQFYFNNEGDRGRHIQDYKVISKLHPNVKLQSIETDSFELIKAAEGVITITGTVGFEAGLIGKKVLTFGRVWYDQLESVFHIKNCSLKTFFTQDSSKKTVNTDRFVKRLEKQLISCKPYKAHSNLSDISDIQAVENLKRFINNEILN